MRRKTVEKVSEKVGRKKGRIVPFSMNKGVWDGVVVGV